MKSIEDIQRDNRAGYKVPEGYFSELNHKILDCTQVPAPTVGRWAAMKGMMTFAASFVVMVVVAIVGFYFTGYQAQNSEMENDSMYFVSIYDVQLDEIIAAQAEDDSNNELFAEAAIEYLTTQGYDISEIIEEQ